MPPRNAQSRDAKGGTSRERAVEGSNLDRELCIAPMSEYLHVERPFLDQLGALGWTVVDQGHGIIPSEPAASLRVSFREWLLPEGFRNAVRGINRSAGGQEWLTERQLEDLRDQLIRHPSRTLLEANEAVQRLLFKTQVDVNEVTGEPD